MEPGAIVTHLGRRAVYIGASADPNWWKIWLPDQKRIANAIAEACRHMPEERFVGTIEAVNVESLENLKGVRNGIESVEAELATHGITLVLHGRAPDAEERAYLRELGNSDFRKCKGLSIHECLTWKRAGYQPTTAHACMQMGFRNSVQAEAYVAGLAACRRIAAILETPKEASPTLADDALLDAFDMEERALTDCLCGRCVLVPSLAHATTIETEGWVYRRETDVKAGIAILALAAQNAWTSEGQDDRHPGSMKVRASRTAANATREEEIAGPASFPKAGGQSSTMPAARKGDR